MSGQTVTFSEKSSQSGINKSSWVAQGSCSCGGGVKKRKPSMFLDSICCRWLMMSQGNRVIAVSPRHGGKLCPPEVKSEVRKLWLITM